MNLNVRNTDGQIFNHKVSTIMSVSVQIPRHEVPVCGYLEPSALNPYFFPYVEGYLLKGFR